MLLNVVAIDYSIFVKVTIVYNWCLWILCDQHAVYEQQQKQNYHFYLKNCFLNEVLLRLTFKLISVF